MSYYSGNNLILISPIVVCIVAFELTRLVLDDYNKEIACDNQVYN